MSIKYNPKNPLTDKELDELAEKDFDLFGYGSSRITPDDCWEQIRDWAGDFAREKIKSTPEGRILASLEHNKKASLKEVFGNFLKTND